MGFADKSAKKAEGYVEKKGVSGALLQIYLQSPCRPSNPFHPDSIVPHGCKKTRGAGGWTGG